MLLVIIFFIIFTVIYLEEKFMSQPEIKFELKGVFNPKNILISALIYTLGIVVALLAFTEIDKLNLGEDADLTKLFVGVILGLLKGIIDDILNLSNANMSNQIEKALNTGYSRLDSHFTPRNPVYPESEDGIVIKLNSHFEEGGVIEKIQGDVAELKGHFEDGGIIVKMYEEIKKLRAGNEMISTPNRRREKSR
jgi:hypothetical protein